MPYQSIIWDLDDDPDGNVQHCAQHGVSKEEMEEVFQNATDEDVSRSAGIWWWSTKKSMQTQYTR